MRDEWGVGFLVLLGTSTEIHFFKRRLKYHLNSTDNFSGVVLRILKKNNYFWGQVSQKLHLKMCKKSPIIDAHFLETRILSGYHPLKKGNLWLYFQVEFQNAHIKYTLLNFVKRKLKFFQKCFQRNIIIYFWHSTGLEKN